MHEFGWENSSSSKCWSSCLISLPWNKTNQYIFESLNWWFVDLFLLYLCTVLCFSVSVRTTEWEAVRNCRNTNAYIINSTSGSLWIILTHNKVFVILQIFVDFHISPCCDNKLYRDTERRVKSKQQCLCRWSNAEQFSLMTDSTVLHYTHEPKHVHG